MLRHCIRLTGQSAAPGQGGSATDSTHTLTQAISHVPPAPAFALSFGNILKRPPDGKNGANGGSAQLTKLVTHLLEAGRRGADTSGVTPIEAKLGSCPGISDAFIAAWSLTVISDDKRALPPLRHDR